MLHVPILPAPTVKLDIQRLLKSTPSPPSLPPISQPSRPYTTSYPSFTPVPSASAAPPALSPAPQALHPAPSQERPFARAQASQIRRAQEPQTSPFPSAGHYLVAAQRDGSPESGPSVPSTTASTGSPGSSAVALGKRPAPDEQHPSATPAKKQSKWTSAENATIISLRGQGMKWEDVSRRLPGRSPTSCRLHYQNYLERRMSWDDEKKNKLARLYERCVPISFSSVAYEVAQQGLAFDACESELFNVSCMRFTSIRAGFAMFLKGCHMCRNDRRKIAWSALDHEFSWTSSSTASIHCHFQGCVQPLPVRRIFSVESIFMSVRDFSRRDVLTYPCTG